MPTVDLGPHKIEYSIVRGTSRRYTYFRFRQDLTLEVLVPRGRETDVLDAIRERRRWLGREYDRLSRTKNVLSRQAVMFDGKPMKLEFSYDARDSLTFDNDGSKVTVRSSDPSRVRELVRRWFLSESSAYAVHKVRELAPDLGVKPSRVDVREIGKWGYCTRTGRVSFSWQLIALPERLREYVVLHELIHLVHFDHSQAFRRHLSSFCADYRERERELDLVAPYERLGSPG